jgi:hypothetical protein
MGVIEMGESGAGARAGALLAGVGATTFSVSIVVVMGCHRLDMRR